MKKVLVLLSIFAVMTGCTANKLQLSENNIQEIVDSLTLDEKVRLLVGTCTDPAMPPFPAPGTMTTRPYFPGEANTYRSRNKILGSAGESFKIDRLGIPSIVYADGPAGVRIDPSRASEPGKDFRCTAFPSSALLASTWDHEAVRTIGQSMGQEALEYGVDIILAPGMNIIRNPLTGRNFEYYSEDPLLSGTMASAMVQGIQSQGVGTSVKHFAVNNQETYRNGINAIVSDRALRELYLKGFEIVVREARPWTIMSSYNKINGECASENSRLLKDILREEWGFDGFVMTDWWGADDPIAQMKAGNNLLMPGTPYQIEEIKEAVRNGTLDENVLDENLKEIFNIITRTPSFRKYGYSNSPDLTGHGAITRDIATEGMVLLKNNGTLPLNETMKIALFGNYSYDTQVGGSGSGYVYRKYKINISDGLSAAGHTINGELKNLYTTHISKEKSKLPPENFWTIPVVPEMEVTKDLIDMTAEESDIAIITLGRMSGEGEDRRPDKGDYLLTDQENNLLENVCTAFHGAGKKVVVVLNTGSSIEMTGWNSLPDAILLAWFPGQEAGNSVADILGGKVNPSGKLPVTFAKQYSDIPSSRNFGVSEGETSAVRYEEELMVGYRHFVTSGTEPEYPFGYGLSYTQFRYSGFKARETSDKITFNIKVTNTGNHDGKDVIQIYMHRPALEPGLPAKELCAFAKTDIIRTGDTVSMKITIDKNTLRQWNTADSRWTLASGEYTFYLSSDSMTEHAKVSLTL